MRLTELMLLYTSPIHWERSPSTNALNLKNFLIHMLDPAKPGLGSLGVSTANWLSGDDAIRWIEHTYQEVWSPGARVLETSGSAMSEEVFYRYEEHRCEVFLDEERLEACLLEAELHAETPDDTYLGFSVKWSRVTSLVWTPQLRACNYWPRNPRFAPPRPPEITSPAPLGPEDTLRIFEDLTGRVADRLISLFFHFGLREASVVPGPRSFEPPVFYYARSVQMPKSHEMFLSPEYLPDLERLGRELIMTHDLLSADVTGAFLEGNLLTFRREIRQEAEVRAHYLIVPWLPEEERIWEEEVEAECVYVADSLAYTEFSVGYGVYELVAGLPMSSSFMSLWSSTLKKAASTVRDLQPMVTFKLRGGKRKAGFELVWQLRSSLSRLEAPLLTWTEDILGLEGQWRISKDKRIEFAHRALTARSLPRIAPLLEGLGHIGPYRLYEEEVNGETQRARQVREQFRSVTTALQSMLDQQDREEREREERNNRILGYGLAALAAVTAFPILIGEQNWDELQAVAGEWTGPFEWIASLLEVSHSALVLIATLSAGTLIFLLFGLLMWWVFAPQIRWHRDELSHLGGRIGDLRLLADVAEIKLTRLLQAASAQAEPQEIEKLRQELETLDTQACEQLVQAWNWLEEKQSRAMRPNSVADVEGYAEALRADTEWLIVSNELLDNRLAPYWLPRALCIYRYRYDSVSPYEFKLVLSRYGFSAEEIETVDDLVKQLREELPPQEFVIRLVEKGVSAIQDRPLAPLTGQLTSGGERPQEIDPIRHQGDEETVHRLLSDNDYDQEVS